MNCNKGSCGDAVIKGLIKCTHQRNQEETIIACDIDDVLADLLGEWIQRYNEDYDDTLSTEKLTSWMISKQVKPECGDMIFNYLKNPNLYDCVDPLPGALEVVNQLREIGRVIFVTSCEGPVQRDQKYAWLQKHGFLAPGHKQGADYITAKDKWLIGADFLIDDAAHNIEAFPRRGLLVTRPHNLRHQLTKGVRLGDFSEAPARIRIVLNS